MAHQLFHLPRPTAISSNLTLVAGAKVGFFLTATSTPTNSYQDSALTTPHANPVIADSAGRLPAIYLDPEIVYRITFKDSSDIEIYPAIDPANDQILSQAIIGRLLYPSTDAEIAAAVTIVNYAIPSHDIIGYAIPERYGNNTTPGTTNMTTAVQAALNVGVSVLLIDNYAVSALTLSASDVTVCGPGKLTKIANVDGRVLYITGHRNKIIGVRFDGTAVAPTSGSLNDMVRVQGGNDNTIENCYINGSKGGGIRIDGGARNRVIDNIILNVYHNSILVANPGADDNYVSGNFCNGTTTGNNIFLTADDGSAASGEFIYRNIVANNQCTSAADTGIEAGYHSWYTTVAGNFVTGSVNPPILLRDVRGCLVTGNNILNTAYASQSAEYGAIAVVPHHEAASYDYSSKISDNLILGAAKRSNIYIGGSHVSAEGNRMYDNATSVTAAGVGLLGQGIALAGAVTDVDVKSNYVRGFEIGIDLNQDASALARTRVIVADNTVYETATAINCFNCTFTDSVIRNNDLTKVVTNGLNVSSITGGTTGELIYQPGVINLAGWSGATPAHINSTTAFTRTFAAADATPSVLNGSIFTTDSGALTITAFDDGYHGQEIKVISAGAVTYDLTANANMVGSSVDIVTADGDITIWVCNGTTQWRLLGFVDVSVDNSAGA